MSHEICIDLSKLITVNYTLKELYLQKLIRILFYKFISRFRKNKKLNKQINNNLALTENNTLRVLDLS